jgi:quercetin dioxygenase-like cupin family protein
MSDLDRRSALALGLAGLSGLVLSDAAAAQTYGPNEGKELGPGVRQVDLGERESLIPAYKTVRLRDIVVQPGAKTPDNMMMNDMLCHITEGELAVVQNGKPFAVKQGDVWTCARGITRSGDGQGHGTGERSGHASVTPAAFPGRCRCGLSLGEVPVRLAIRRLLPVLAVLGLVLASFTAPALAGGMAAPIAAMAADGMALAGDMDCCPPEQPIMPDCLKACPLLTVCLAKTVQCTSAASAMPVRIGTADLLIPGNDAPPDTVAHEPPPRPSQS